MSESKIKTTLRQLGDIMDKSELEGVNEVKPIKGAKDSLERLSSRDIKIGILTRCCKAYAVEALKRCGMISLVDFIEARSDLLEAKPNAVSAWRLCKMLGVEPDEAVIVGDHWIDVECANSAGIDFIGVLSGLSDKDTLEKAGCKTFAKNITKIEDMLNLTG